jgi:glutathione S-transferase
MFHYTTIVTILAIAFYIFTCIQAGSARAKGKVMAPATAGDALFERAFRVQMNTLEWLPVVLPGLWFFAIYVSDTISAVLGIVWVVGRVLYMQGYMEAPEKRGPGFGIQAAAGLILLIGGLVGVLVQMVHGG